MNTKTLLSLAVCLAAVACAKPCRVVWTEGPTDPESGKTIHTMTIQNPPAGTDWTLWFSQFRTPVKMQEGAKAEILHHGGTLYRVAPTAEAEGNEMVLRYEARALVNQCRAPEGFHLQVKGKKPVPVEVEYVFLPSEPVHTFDYTPADLTAYDMIPRLKKVDFLGGSTGSPTEESPVTELAEVPGDIPATYVDGQKHGWYRITLDEGVKVEAADPDGAYYASVTLANLKRNAKDGTVPSAVIEDWPDLPYRGIMLDVSRNFTTKADLLKLIDILAHYKVNRLHLHFGDDEGWRVEMDGLPELTSYGAYRGIPTLNEDGTISEPDALMYTYCVTPDRNDTKTSGNGFYTKADYIEILKYADAHHMLVVPEFDIPGHSRAAVKSMEYRYRTTGDATYRLFDPADTSKYNSAQDYCDNVIDVSLPSTYAFIEKVFDNLIALHAEAGVPLEAVHLPGADEGERRDGHRLAQGLLHEPRAGHRRGPRRQNRRLAGGRAAPGARHLRAGEAEPRLHELLGGFSRPGRDRLHLRQRRRPRGPFQRPQHLSRLRLQSVQDRTRPQLGRLCGRAPLVLAAPVRLLQVRPLGRPGPSEGPGDGQRRETGPDGRRQAVHPRRAGTAVVGDATQFRPRDVLPVPEGARPVRTGLERLSGVGGDHAAGRSGLRERL